MSLTKGLIMADIIAARQAIAYYDEKELKISRTLRRITCNKQRKN